MAVILEDEANFFIDEENYIIPHEYRMSTKNGTLLHTPPIASNEDEDPNKFWTVDKMDKFLPKDRGFIHDFIYHLRGTEVPTGYALWSALWMLSTVIKREAWLDWFPGKLYSNFYCILIGPAGFKKTTAISILNKVVDEMPNHLEHEKLKLLKEVNIIKNKFTPEALLAKMDRSEEIIPIKDADGHAIRDGEGGIVRWKPSSELGIVLSEMSVAINKQKYSETMIQNLLDLYDCHDQWHWETKGGGAVTLEKLHTTLIAATTPDGFAEAIPNAATGDGFISRTILVYQDQTKRRFYKPVKVDRAPTQDMLSKRLAWIATHCMREYKLTPEAEKYYERWYHSFCDKLDSNPETRGIYSRFNINVLKVAMLLQISSYTPHRCITKQNIIDAERLLDGMYNGVPGLLNTITNSDKFHTNKAKVEDKIKLEGTMTRRQLQLRIKLPAKELNAILHDLILAEIIVPYDEDKKIVENPTYKGKEIYRWVGENGLYNLGGGFG